MKYLLFIAIMALNKVSYAQNNNVTPTTAPPPYYVSENNALTNNSVNNNTGTPMVTNPVENNNPSVQASIPINNKPPSIEVDIPQNNYTVQPRIVNNNSQQNTTVKNKTTDATPNVPGVVTATSVTSDSLSSNVIAAPPTSAPLVKSTVVYNNNTGVDISSARKSTTAKLANGNSVPVRQTFVSENIVTKFKNIYGDNLYDIRLIRSTNNDVKYVIRILDNGLFKTMYLTEEGEVIR